MLIVLIVAGVGVLVLGLGIGFLLARPRRTDSFPTEQGIFVTQDMFGDASRPIDGGTMTPAELDPATVDEAKQILQNVLGLGQTGGSRFAVFGMLSRLPTAYMQASALLNRLTPAERQVLGQLMKDHAETIQQTDDPRQMQPLIDMFAGLTSPEMANRQDFNAAMLMQGMADERSRRSSISGAVAFGILALVIAGAAIGYAMVTGDVWPYLQSNGWQETTGKIISADVETHRGEDSDGFLELKYSLNLRYAYQVGEQEYVNNRIQFNWDEESRLESDSEIDELLIIYPVGKTVSIYYDPDDPNDAVLQRSLRPGASLFFGAFCGVVALVLILLVAPIVFMRRIVFGGMRTMGQ